jgi:Domain of unknown function (DUF4259)
MGSWSDSIIENDTAADWNESGYLEAPICEEALVAAEVVAALGGRPSPTLPNALVVWADTHRTQGPAALLQLALSATMKILSSSELKELWEEGGSEQWLQIVRDLLKRLREQPVT